MWVELLDGTTPGPWKTQTDYRGFHRVLAIAGRELSGLRNSTLIAAAPDAVAEVVRLRRAIKAQSLMHAECASAYGAAAARAGVGDRERWHHLLDAHGQACKALERILNGDTDD